MDVNDTDDANEDTDDDDLALWRDWAAVYAVAGLRDRGARAYIAFQYRLLVTDDRSLVHSGVTATYEILELPLSALRLGMF